MYVQRLTWLLLFGLMALACNDPAMEPQACYPEDREWPNDGAPYFHPLGFCQWSYEELSRGPDGRPKALPDAPPNMELNVVVHCFDLSDGEICNACPAEETDALLLEEFEAKCGYEATYFQRGCYLPTEGDDGRPRCCYKALIGPACTDRD